MRGERLARPGFTLVELLVVMGIVLLVTVLTIPAALQAYAERGVQESARLVHAAISAARDASARDGLPHGIRFGPDPTLPGHANRLVPIGPAPDYSEGLLTTTDIARLPADFVLPYPCLMVEQTIYGPGGAIVPPTNWAHNVRVGDRLRIGDAGPWMTVVGPTDPAHPTDEGFVVQTQMLDRGDGHGRIDYLWVVNGVDDDHDGFIDDGWDGVDNNADGVTDELFEWEVERWQRHVPVIASPYAIRRRPVPVGATRTIDLPSSVVIDTKDLPAEFLVDATGAAMPSLPYGVPSAIGIKDHELRIHLIERGTAGHEAWISLNTRTGNIAAEQ